jgi:flagellar biosynthesis/type III secretory pathway protein FliH
MASSDAGSGNKLVPPGAVVRTFEMPILGQEQRRTYQSIKKTFTVDSGSTKDSRFLLSDMVHSQLSVEAEEERRFNDRIALEMERLSQGVHESAYKDGYAAGQEEGKKLAFEQERSRLAALIEGLTHSIGTIAEAKLKLAESYESRLVALAYRMASVVVDHQIEQNPEFVTHSIRAILEKIGQEEDIRIRLSADDHAIITQVEENLKGFSHKGRISLDLDSSLKRGDCIVEASSGEIASFIEEKVGVLRSELKKIYPKIDLEQKTGT